MIKAIITKGGLLLVGSVLAYQGYAQHEAHNIGTFLGVVMVFIGACIVIGTCLTIREGERVVEHGDVHAHNSEH